MAQPTRNPVRGEGRWTKGRETQPDGACHTTRTRLACCLSYTIKGGEACVTCPRTPDAVRIRRLA